MYVIRLSFNFRYNRDTRINVDIPVDEYIASGRELHAYDVWDHIRESEDLRDQISAQQPDFEQWMSQWEIYDKSLQRSEERVDIVKVAE